MLPICKKGENKKKCAFNCMHVNTKMPEELLRN